LSNAQLNGLDAVKEERAGVSLRLVRTRLDFACLFLPLRSIPFITLLSRHVTHCHAFHALSQAYTANANTGGHSHSFHLAGPELDKLRTEGSVTVITTQDSGYTHQVRACMQAGCCCLSRSFRGSTGVD